MAALVFGREESGLLDSELALCSHACAIPTGDAYGQPSMNLSSAVSVVLAQVGSMGAGPPPGCRVLHASTYRRRVLLPPRTADVHRLAMRGADV